MVGEPPYGQCRQPQSIDGAWLGLEGDGGRSRGRRGSMAGVGGRYGSIECTGGAGGSVEQAATTGVGPYPIAIV
jgi:hypothetical protein